MKRLIALSTAVALSAFFMFTKPGQAAVTSVQAGSRNLFNNIVTFAAQLKVSNGTAAEPSVVFTSDDDATGTGFYRVGTNNFGIATNGTLRWDISTTAETHTLMNLFPAGTAAAPSIALNATTDDDTGFYLDSEDGIGVGVNGLKAFTFDTGGLNVSNGYFIYADGSGNASAPGIAFQGDGNTGIDNPAGDTINIIGGGMVGLSVGAAGIIQHVLQQGDLTATCTLGMFQYDTGGITDEICYCQATNTWFCTAVTAGPLD